MSTTTPQPQLRLVRLREIQIAEGANPRRCFDEQALAELADSIKTHGVLQPLVVTARPEGGYTLVAGERRYRAAKLAKLSEVPVAIRDGDQAAIELAVDENLHRRDLNPVEEAHAFQTILTSGRLTKKQLAERVSKSASYVNERLRLLALPEPIQQQVAAGVVPVRLAKQLIEMAKASDPVAVCCVQLVADGHADLTELEERPERLIGCLGDYQWPDPQPVALAVSGYQHYQLDDLPLPEGCEDIAERTRALEAEYGSVGFVFRDEEADAARGYGCLLEIKRERFFAHAYITDPAFIADRVRQQLDQLEKQAAERQRHPATADGQHDSGGKGGDVEAEVERRRQEREQRLEATEAAVAANFELGRKLQLRYDAPKLTTRLAKLLALLVLDREAEKLAGRGLRYVREDWQLVETVASRGRQVEKRRYPEAWETAEQLYAQIERSRTPEQVIGRLLQALLAAYAADEEALPMSKRVYWETPGSYGEGPSSEIPAILERLAKPVLPRQLAAKRQPDEAAQAA